MNRFASLTRLLAITALAGAAALSAHAASAPGKDQSPKLVVVMVIDGLPNEQVLRYRDQFAKDGGLRRLLEQGAAFSNAHQAHGVTVTAVGHSAVLSGAYPYRHGIIGNNWLDADGKTVYCTEDQRYHYIDEETGAHDGTSPHKLRVDTLGDQLRYATGDRAKVVTVSGKDRGAILLAGKTGTAYMYMDKTGDFATSTFYMQSYPEWVQRFRAARPQDRFYGKSWNRLLPDAAYAGDAPYPEPTTTNPNRFPFIYHSESGAPDAKYYERLKVGPAVDQLTLEFARAAVEGENLGRNPAGVPDLLGISLSGHDYVNHAYGPESVMSHDHLQQLDRMIGSFFGYLDKRIGLDNVLVVLTADHGFANSPEFSQARHIDALRINPGTLVDALNADLEQSYGVAKLVKRAMLPEVYLDYEAIDKRGLSRSEVENRAARFLLAQPGIAQVFTRTQFENGGVQTTRLGVLMQRAWNRQLSGDLMVVPTAYSIYSSGTSGATHGNPYDYDTNVPVMIMGGRWIKPGAYGNYTEVVDIAPTLAHLLRVRPPAAAEGRVLTEALR
ncbi:alkaline phosphatase family protein [Massilia terrae]|uniref:Alkaline phosphatase family protein n=1 Tax=Massilia terrae TaxID=1811224 RepID=A0ABT2CSV8_9BURK|nr:alkaline phosphatase family protein [Massilia terrae]MCS0656661.1 alkaline phosphatase family protein [Massilia terrae]